MPLISSKLVILTLLVIFLTGCSTSTIEIQLSPSDTFIARATLTVSTTSSQTPTQTQSFPVPSQMHTPIPVTPDDLVPTVTSTTADFYPNVSVFPNPDDFIWEVIAEGFVRPTGLANPNDGTGRLFILEQIGLIHIIENGEILPEPYLDLRELTSTEGSTVHGLLGMTFHPEYDRNGFFYVHYTQKGGSSVIARYRVSNNPNVADTISETVLVKVNYPIGEHVGGGLAFGPDGYLYISIGDGGAAGNGDEAGNAQNANTLPGSLLRLDVNSSAEPEIWAYGLRNPWRFSFDAVTGDIYIADVGENRWEEINYLPAGSYSRINFGWNFYEGAQSFRGRPPENQEMTFPIWTYDHTLGCSVTGGYVYRGRSLPEWSGIYIYGDYCTGNIWGLIQLPDGTWQNELLYKLPAYITSFGQDQDGEIYLVSITGIIYKLVKKG